MMQPETQADDLSNAYLSYRSIDNGKADVDMKIAEARKKGELRRFMQKGQPVTPESMQNPAAKEWMMNLPRNITAGTIDAATNSLDLILGDAKDYADQWLTDTFPEYAQAVSKLRNWMNPKNEADETTQMMAQFMVPFTGYMKLFGATNKAFTSGKTLANAIGSEIVTDVSAMNPHMERFAGILKEFGLESAFLDYVSDTQNETEAEGRLKNAIDDLVIGDPLISGVFGAAKAMKWTWHNAPEIAKRIKEYEPVIPGSREAQRGAVAFHGSGAKFNEFDIEKVGSGEGAAAYGWGAAYLAESPGVAKTYRDIGRPFLTDVAVESGLPKPTPGFAARVIKAYEKNPDAPIDEVVDDVLKNTNTGKEYGAENIKKLIEDSSYVNCVSDTNLSWNQFS